MKEFDFSAKTTKELEERLDYLFNVAVEKNKERIKAARALGNFSENSEYDHAK
jgi:transcription elongation GreA/GreB family factor